MSPFSVLSDWLKKEVVFPEGTDFFLHLIEVLKSNENVATQAVNALLTKFVNIIHFS
jgi:hypothetical protein